MSRFHTSGIRDGFLSPGQGGARNQNRGTTLGKAKHIDEAKRFDDLPNIGKEMAKDFARLGIETPKDLARQDPDEMFLRIGELTGDRHDPCVLDTYRAVVDFAKGGPSRPWWDYTPLRKIAK